MRKYFNLSAWTFVLLSLTLISCSKGGSGGTDTGGNPPPPDQTLTVVLDKTTINADGFEDVVVTVKDQNGADVTASASVFVNDMNRPAKRFWTETPGTYKVKAQKGTIISPEVTITAVDPGNSAFSQKILVEDFTGTWCGYCPRVGIKLEEYTATKPNCIVVANHGGQGTADPYLFQYHSSMASAFQLPGYPGALLSRVSFWNENNSQLDLEFAKRAPLGLALNTSLNGNDITVNTKVKFDVTTSIDLKLIVYLLEDGLVYPQVNYGYNYNGFTGSPINNYVHNAVLRKTITDVYGDAIDKSKQVKGTTYEKSQTISITGAGYNTSKLRVVAFVVYGDGNFLQKKGVSNIQSVAVGSNKDFD
ncbi:MAG: Omp28-related outer membrane protein [Chitinophagales bacterium]|nr:Omp28-related outer membrane protein [Chitinophagales bacterium]